MNTRLALLLGLVWLLNTGAAAPVRMTPVKIADNFAGHSYVDHGEREYARGEVHNNTAATSTDYNNVGGNLQVNNDTAATDVSGLVSRSSMSKILSAPAFGCSNQP